MPEVQEVFRMATQNVDPDPGALERQHRFQRRTTTRRKVGAFAVAAAIAVAAIAVILATRPGGNATSPANEAPAVSPVETGIEPVGTVTFDGSTCSMEITADRIEPGVMLFEAINATDQRVMFDSWQLLEGYTFRTFETAIERSRESAENGQIEGGFPEGSGSDRQVTYLGSDVIPANSSGTFAATMSSGTHAIVCLQPYELNNGRSRTLPFGIVGPIDVG
jgi:hypothetical protein